jgi:hypothetical protein
METIPVTPAAETPAMGAVTFTISERKKKKKKYSRGLKDVQKLDRGMAKASRRVSKAIADGLGTYLKASRKSAEKHRDGAIIDAFENWAKATGKTLRRASDAPEILANTINTRASRRRFRTLVRLSVSPFSR